jgi:DNA helicase-2/ATP-dependent DNA helicase PcrA
MRKIIYGPPGTGKTTTLLGIVEDALSQGVPPNRIGFVSFTKKAVREAAERASTRFKIPERSFPYFRTLHSMAFHRLGLRPDAVMSHKHFREFAKIVKIPVTGFFSTDEGSSAGYAKGDRMLFLENLARLRCIPLEQQWREESEDIPWFEMDRTARAFVNYKHSNALCDFTDMIAEYVRRDASPPLDLLVVDEAQDLSTLQWKMVDLMSREAGETVIAGDDDQAIFRWAGADVQQFISLEGEKRVLQQSYRIPRAVHDLSDKLLKYIRDGNRAEKSWASREEEGEVHFHRKITSVDMSTGSWLVLARNTYILEQAEEKLKSEGYIYEIKGKPAVDPSVIEGIKLYESVRSGKTVSGTEMEAILKLKLSTQRLSKEFKERRGETFDKSSRLPGITFDRIWHETLDAIPLQDRVYIVAARKRGEKVTKTPRIKLSTIHGAKGGEADNVVLFTDVADRTFKQMHGLGLEDEARVFYVGATRARSALHIVYPETNEHFKIPT